MKPYLPSAALLCLVALPSALAAQQAVISPVGEVRVRFEADRPSTVDTLDAFTLLRTRLGVDARFGSGARAFIQVQDSRAFGEEAGTLDGSAETFDMHQGWLELARRWEPVQLSARVGRQEIALGSERLLGAVGWSNVGRSFDALRVDATPARLPWVLTGVVATVSERGRRMGVTPEVDDDHTLLVLWAEGRLLDAFVFHDRSARYRTFEGVDRTTLGGRLDVPAHARMQGFAEGAYQLGNQLDTERLRSQDIAAWLLTGRAWLPLEGRLRSVGAGLDWLSGDADPTDDEYGAFNTLYATNHKFYGYLDLFTDPAAQTGDRGLVDAVASAQAQLTERVGLAVDLHGFWFTRTRAAEERMIGWELDLTLPVAMGTGQRLALGYSAFRAGPGASLIGRGAEGGLWHWAYAQASVSF
ncbi:MAG TPA: alginate export family protein [Longimicrobiales bacterium]|nr:alginate export family protein [Longimicrobiales bacterium]